VNPQGLAKSFPLVIIALVRIFRIGFLALLFFPLSPLLSPGQAEKEKASPVRSPSTPLGPDQVYFVAPLGAGSDPLSPQAAMDLGLDYAPIKYPYGMVNLLDPAQTPVEYSRQAPITDLDKVLQVENESGIKIGEKFTLVTPAGKVYPASVTAFAYYGNSPSTMLVSASLRIKLPGPDPAVATRPSLALRGAKKITPNPRVRLWPEVKVAPELIDKLRLQAVPAGRRGETISNFRLVPGRLSGSEALDYFVSYWHRPMGAFDLEDARSAGYLFRLQGKELVDLNLPSDLEVQAVLDLTGDGKAEILGMAGDGALACHRLFSWDGHAFRLIKEGLCAGY